MILSIVKAGFPCLIATLILGGNSFAAPDCMEGGGTEFPQTVADAGHGLDVADRASRFPAFKPIPREIQRGCTRLSHRISFQFVVKKNNERIDGGHFYIERDPATGEVFIETEGSPVNPHLLGLATQTIRDDQGLELKLNADSFGETLRSPGPSADGGVPDAIAPCVEAAFSATGRKIFNQY